MSDIIIKDLSHEKESSLHYANSVAVEQARQIQITNESEYKQTTEFVKTIKERVKTIEITFAEMKTQAHKAHKAICEKENSYKKPLQEAESIVKQKMQAYYMEQERIRREEEARIREAQRKLAEEELKRAAELEKAGKVEQAQVALQTATQIENLNTVIENANLKINGVSTVDDYEIKILDASKVSAYINGIEIRPIDLAKVKRLAKDSSGKIEIPGIAIVPTKSIRVKA